MKRNTLLILSLASMMSFGTLFSAEAAEKTITHVNLSIFWDKAPKGGDLVGEVSASGGGSEFVVEGAEYLEQDDTWQQGVTPAAEIELSAQSGYRFRNGGKSYFTLSGCNARFESVEMEEDGSAMTLTVAFPKINGILPGTGAMGWNGNEAVWDLVGGASRYEIRLYKDGKLMTTVSTGSESYDFSDYINNEGEYYFMVRAAGNRSNQSSAWSERSEVKTLTAEDAWDSGNGTWKQVGGKWRYVYKNGVYPVNSWRYIGNDWYYFDGSGYMVTNTYIKSADSKTQYWLDQDGKWDAQWDKTENAPQ